MRNKRPLRFFGENRKPETYQNIFKNLDVGFYDFTLNLRFPGDIADIQNRSLREADDFQEARKIAYISYEAFVLDFFPDIKGNISIQYLPAIRGVDDDW